MKRTEERERNAQTKGMMAVPVLSHAVRGNVWRAFTDPSQDSTPKNALCCFSSSLCTSVTPVNINGKDAHVFRRIRPVSVVIFVVILGCEEGCKCFER